MSAKEALIYLDPRGGAFIFHWFILNIAGLLDFNTQPKPVKFTVDISEPFHRETIELLKPDFEYVEAKDISKYDVINYHGAPLLPSQTEVEPRYYHFLREQILIKNKLNIQNVPKRRLYISRNKSHTLKCNQDCFQGNIKRKLYNEEMVYECLEELGFEFIYLEDYSLKEKIKIFQEAEIIVTPNGGALTMALFANEKTKIIEINSHCYDNHTQYYILCKNIGLNIHRYNNTQVVNFDIFIHDCNHFKEFVGNQLS